MKKILAILIALTLALTVGIAAMAEKTELWGEGLKIGLAQMHYTNAYPYRGDGERDQTPSRPSAPSVVWNEAGNDTATQVANAKDLLAQDIDYLLPAAERGSRPGARAGGRQGSRRAGDPARPAPPTASPASTT